MHPASSAHQGATGPVLAGPVLADGRAAFVHAQPGCITVDETTAQETAHIAAYVPDHIGYRLTAGLDDGPDAEG